MFGQCLTKSKICPTKQKTHQTICQTGKTRDKMKCRTRLCFYPTINGRCPTKLLILSNKYLFNKSFLINKLQYPKYTFFQKHFYRKTLQIYNSKWFIFTPSSANKQKHWIQNNLIFSIWEQFLIPLEKAGMTLSFMIFWNTSTD